MSENTFAPIARQQESRTLTPLDSNAHVVVIGAGAFGGWTALNLLKQKFKVTLVDSWGAGNSRSSSGDETRVIRSTYGANEFYFNLNIRALQLWKDYEERWQRKLFENKGVLWLCHQRKTPVVDDSIHFAQQHGMMYEELTRNELAKRYPIVNAEDLSHAWFDPYGGLLYAREAMQTVQQAFVQEGGTFIQAQLTPGSINHARMQSCQLSNGQSLIADVFIFACGSWLGKMFPEILGSMITCTRQEVYYFGMPELNAAQYESFPVWINADGHDWYYGIPGNHHRGFKVGVDKRGEAFDPTHGNRVLNTDVLHGARTFIAHRFPGLTNQPLVENRVCPYENSPDGNFLFDQHPEADNVIFLGGGSGHGFKHGPALGEWVTRCLTGLDQIPGDFLMR